ncbi:MAG: ABC transporter ATP-binding protein [Prolixibacteraceae bacterium]|nr:ABC transporter ATP-binding protein [Burkholderiales bacterium]
MLRTKGLRLAYPGRILVEGLSIEFQPGELWAVLGRNGSGKSTLLHALGALRQPEAGDVQLQDAMIGTLPRRALARRIGVLLQEESREFWGSVRDYVLLGRYPHARSAFGWSEQDERIADSEIEALHLGEFGNRAFASLSGGERQRARAAALFAQQPAVYLLDEPLQHLDLPHQVAVLERLSGEARNRGAIVVMVMHDLLFAARYCNRFLLLFGDGRFSVGTADEAMTAEHLGELYGFPLVPVEVGGERLFLPGRQSGQGSHV